MIQSPALDDKWQSPAIVQGLVDQMKRDPDCWQGIISELREADRLQAVGEAIGKRIDLEPEEIPERQSPSATEIAAEFLKKIFNRRYQILNAQLVLRIRQIVDAE